MRILVDTNVLISAILLPGSRPSAALYHAARNHDLVLCDQNLREFHEVVARKAPQVLPDVDAFFAELPYELVPAVYSAEKLIRDAKDQPILDAAIVSNVDVIITGDKDFLCMGMELPRCITAAQYLEEFTVTE